MDIGKSFSYITEDQDWLKKTLIGALLALVVVGLPALIGWMVEIIRRVANGDPSPLPDWDNLGEFFMTGIKLLVIGFVWSLPITVLVAIFAGSAAAMGSSMSEDMAGWIFSFGGICMSLFVMVYTIALWLLSGPLLAQLGDGVKWSTLINPKPSFDLFKRNAGGFLIAALLGNIIVNVLAAIGTILCGVGSFWGTAYGTAVMGHLLGQAYAQAKAAV